MKIEIEKVLENVKTELKSKICFFLNMQTLILIITPTRYI